MNSSKHSNNNLHVNPIKLDSIVLTEIIGLDTEFNSLIPTKAEVLVISIKTQNNDTYAISTAEYPEDEVKTFLQKLQKEVKTVVCHNAKIDAEVLYCYYGVLLTNLWCTMLASQIINNGKGLKVSGGTLTKDFCGDHIIPISKHPHSLLDCLYRHLGVSEQTSNSKKSMQLSFTTLKHGREKITEEQLTYAAEDVEFLLELKASQEEYIEQSNQQNVIALEQKLTPVLIKMEVHGCLFDTDKHKEFIQTQKIKKEQLQNSMDEELRFLFKDTTSSTPIYIPKYRDVLIGFQLSLFDDPPEEIRVTDSKAINYGSTPDILKVFQDLNVPLPEGLGVKGDHSAARNALQMYITEFPDSPLQRFISLLLEHRETSKLLNTYGDKLLSCIGKDKVVRTSYSQCFTETGRLSSRKVSSVKVTGATRSRAYGLNIANIPTIPELRNCFVPPQGYSFIDIDHQGQEAVIAADYSKDPLLYQAVAEGLDHHSELASITFSLLFGKQCKLTKTNKKITAQDLKGNTITYRHKDLREIHKNCLFCKFYGGGPEKIYGILSEYICRHIPPALRMQMSRKISAALNKALPKLNLYLRNRIKLAKRDGFLISSTLGRRRYFPKQQDFFGEAMNFPIQGCGAESIKLALIRVDKFLRTKAEELNLPSQFDLGWISLTIYDQIVVTLKDEYLHLAEEISNIMGESLTVFLSELKAQSSYSITKCWHKD